MVIIEDVLFRKGLCFDDDAFGGLWLLLLMIADLIKFKLFHLTSIVVLSTFTSSKVMDFKLVLSKISFKGFSVGFFTFFFVLLFSGFNTVKLQIPFDYQLNTKL